MVQPSYLSSHKNMPQNICDPGVSGHTNYSVPKALSECIRIAWNRSAKNHRKGPLFLLLLLQVVLEH